LKTLTDQYKCYFCGIQEPINVSKTNNFRKLIEKHHICEKNQQGNNDSNNIVPVCSNCHSMIHLGLINPKKWLFTTSGWKLLWKDVDNIEYLGNAKISINIHI
jgi:hypothetical protein